MDENAEMRKVIKDLTCTLDEMDAEWARVGHTVQYDQLAEVRDGYISRLKELIDR